MIWILMGILKIVISYYPPKTELFILSGATDDSNLPSYTEDITSHLYVALSNDSKVYKMSNVEDIMNDTRRAIIFNFNYILHGYYMRQRSLICYLISTTYRSAIYDLYRYFPVRDIYVNNLEYEIGYLTQEVMHHYQAVLEIYQIVHKRYVQNSERNFAPVNFVFFLYTNILEKCKVIIHLCNMMHELEEKYKMTKKSKGVFDETHDGVDNYNKPESRANMSDVDRERLAYQNYLKQKEKEERKRQRERKKYQKKAKKFGFTTKRKRMKKKKSSWPLDYGWSIENW